LQFAKCPGRARGGFPTRAVSSGTRAFAHACILISGCGGVPADDGPTGSQTSTAAETVQTAPEVTLVIGISGGGETFPPAGEWVYQAFETVQLQAFGIEGVRFIQWSGDLESRDESPTILLDRDMFVTAEFGPMADDAPPRLFLPWAPGESRTFGQGNNGEYSHSGAFAWDIPMPTGTPVLAVAAGRVVDIHDSSLRNPPGGTEFAQPANSVTIDHGSNLQSYYAHLDFQGVTVVPGQWVVRGQVIGFSGNTGFSTAPHLHYEVLDAGGTSVSTGFFEVEAADGIPEEGDIVTSRNTLNLDTIETYYPTTLPPDIFLANGIKLTGETPPASFYTSETDYVISGQVVSGKSRVCLALVEPDSSETVFCDLTDVEGDGSFMIAFRFPAVLVGRYWLGVISGNGGAEGTTPISVLISPPTMSDTSVSLDAAGRELARPIAVIDPPTDLVVDFLQTEPLTGGSSFSKNGQGLSYRWMQASGPPASIADSIAAETEFTLELGEGINRVSFQLVVFDGKLHSLPASIDFLMPDTFFVRRIGISSTLCESADTCPVFDPPPPLVYFSTDVVLGWVELINAEVGDLLSYGIIDPLGREVQSNEIAVVSEPAEMSFWRFPMSSVALDTVPGIWTGVFKRNGLEEATIGFRIVP
jgi:murein DD-endopeptidase MepM/ murein hydrolase activator NlpD